MAVPVQYFPSVKVAAPQVAVQAHPQAAPRVDLAHRRRRHLRQPHRALPHRHTLALRRAHPYQHAAASHVGLVSTYRSTGYSDTIYRLQ